MLEVNKIYLGDCFELMKQLEDESLDCIVTSPPYYGLRDYGIEGQLGHEKSFREYLDKLLELFKTLKDKLKKEGTCWVNLGDGYANGGGMGIGGKQDTIKQKHFIIKKNYELPDKCLMLIPERFAIGMIDNGWILRNVIIWHKPNPFPESVKDRFSRDYEYVYFFVKSKKYYFKQMFQEYTERMLKAIENKEINSFNKYKKSCGGLNKTIQKGKINGANMRNCWNIPTATMENGHGITHVAMFPKKLVARMLEAGCPQGGLVLDPFMGSGQTAIVAKYQYKNYLGFELNPDYIKEANERIEKERGLFDE